jgi:hypothetical protein
MMIEYYFRLFSLVFVAMPFSHGATPLRLWLNTRMAAVYAACRDALSCFCYAMPCQRSLRRWRFASGAAAG